MINTQHWKTWVFQHSQQWKHEERLNTHLKDQKTSQNYLSLHLSPKQDCNTSRNRAGWEERWTQLQCLQEQSHYTPHTLLTAQETPALSWAHEQYSSTLWHLPEATWPAELRQPWHPPEMAQSCSALLHQGSFKPHTSTVSEAKPTHCNGHWNGTATS